MKRRRVLVVAAVLAACLVLPVVIGLGIVDIPRLPILGNPNPPLGGSSTEVLVDPDSVIKDYLNDPGYQIDDTFLVDVNISAPVAEPDLYTWHVTISYDNDTLNVSNLLYGDFLAGTISPNGTSADVANITGIFNDEDYAWIAESVLGDYAGVDGNGTLFRINFTITGYGCSEMNITTTGSMPTELLDSGGSTISFTMVNGYFKNKLTGDSNGDGYVNSLDNGKINAHWTPAGGQYDRCVDNNDDGYINSLDDGVVNGNWQRTIY